MPRVTLIAMTLLALAAAAAGQTPPAPTPAPTPADLAKAAADEFMRGFQYLNLDDIMKVVEAPWYHNKKTVIYQRAELETDFSRLLEKYKGLPKVKYELRTQATYGGLRAQLPAAERKLIDQVMTPDDFVQLIKLNNPHTNQPETVVLFIRVKDGQARIVGLQN